jgi:hypothetical protein
VDGEIVAAEFEGGWETDEFTATMSNPFTAWLVSTHADQAALMYADWPGWPLTLPALDDRSARLWTKNIDGYVRAVKRGDAF